MTQLASLAAGLVLGVAVLVSGRCAPADELRIEDRSGMRVGRIVRTPDSQIYLQDKTGRRVGRLRPRPDGGYDVQDNTGVRRFTVKPTRR